MTKVKQYEDNWKRALADYQNLVKRVDSEKREFVRFANTNLIGKLLPTLDVLELAAKHNQDQGLQMAVKQFQEVLNDEGLVEITPTVGDNFDPLFHECVEKVEGGTGDSIAEILSKGYKINDFVIRPAKVKVFIGGVV